MIESNNHTNYHFKLVLLKSKWQMFLLSGLVMQVLLVGCTAKDEEAPVITSVKVEDNVVTIEASDNVGVTSYISVGNPRQPSLTDENWQESNTITLDEDGTYYIWVKDSSDNFAQYSETIEMSYNLALKFDHLNWLTPEEGTRVIDGVTYNLAELKAEYGDLYRLVEPLSNEEIESRFAYFAEFMDHAQEERNKTGFFGYYLESGIARNNSVNSVLVDLEYSIRENIKTSKDGNLEIYKEMFVYINSTGLYEIRVPLSFTSDNDAYRLSSSIIERIPFEDKNIFIRYVTMLHELQLKIHSDLNIEPNYVIESWDWE